MQVQQCISKKGIMIAKNNTINGLSEALIFNFMEQYFITQ